MAKIPHRAIRFLRGMFKRHRYGMGKTQKMRSVTMMTQLPACDSVTTLKHLASNTRFKSQPAGMGEH